MMLEKRLLRFKDSAKMESLEALTNNPKQRDTVEVLLKEISKRSMTLESIISTVSSLPDGEKEKLLKNISELAEVLKQKKQPIVVGADVLAEIQKQAMDSEELIELDARLGHDFKKDTAEILEKIAELPKDAWNAFVNVAQKFLDLTVGAAKFVWNHKFITLLALFVGGYYTADAIGLLSEAKLGHAMEMMGKVIPFGEAGKAIMENAPHGAFEGLALSPS